jgi:hypothetical protein
MRFPSRFLSLALVLLLAGLLRAQVPPPPDAGRGGVKNLVYQMRSGNTRVKEDPKNREHIKTVAQWLAFSLCQAPYNGDTKPKALPTDNPTYLIDNEAKAFYDVYSGSTTALTQNQIEFADEFGKAIAEACGVILANPTKPIERVNAVRLMAAVAHAPAPSLADPLVAVVTNPKATDAEKVYAFQGLRNLLEQPDPTDPARHIFGATAGNTKLAEIANALTAYVCQNRAPKNDRERGVIEFVRRDAVTALAKFRDPILRNVRREVIARPGWTLARVMEMDPSVSPPFTIQERIEAAIGLGQMRLDPELNLDVAAHAMADVLVNAAQVANLDNGRASEQKTLPILPWKIYAARWSYALSVWRDGASKAPKNRYPETLTAVAQAGIEMLADVEKNGSAGQTAAGVQSLTTWAKNNPPKAWAEMKSALLFKDDPNSILPFPAPAGPATPKMTTPDPKGPPKGGTPAKKP